MKNEIRFLARLKRGFSISLPNFPDFFLEGEKEIYPFKFVNTTSLSVSASSRYCNNKNTKFGDRVSGTDEDAKAIKNTRKSLFQSNQKQQPLTPFLHEKMRGRVRWDEANLSEIEANKPVRKKIDEPKTPFHPLIQEDAKTMDYAAHAEALQNALSKVALSQRQENVSSEEEGESGAKLDQQGFRQGDALSFTDRRTAHYDEFKKVKELRQKASFLNESGMHDSVSPSALSIETREIDIEDSDDEILQVIEIEENGEVGFPQ